LLGAKSMTTIINKSNVEAVFRKLKNKRAYLDLAQWQKERLTGEKIYLKAVSIEMEDIDSFIVQATAWRKTHKQAFFSQFAPTEERTYRWVERITKDQPDRILFVIENHRATMLGHLDLAFVQEENTFEIGSILKGVKGHKGCMTIALGGLCTWVFQQFPVPYVFLRCFAHNHKAIKLYERCGFQEIQRYPLYAHRYDNGDVVWEPAPHVSKSLTTRDCSLMRKYRES